VGDISGHYFDIHGRPIQCEVADRIMALPWKDFKQQKDVVAIACGLDKRFALVGALRTGVLNRLIIDDQTAVALLESEART
jgi:deoxyribonucleoside regulator